MLNLASSVKNLTTFNTAENDFYQSNFAQLLTKLEWKKLSYHKSMSYLRQS